MDMKIKPLMIAVALALGISSTAFGQAGAGTSSGSAAGDTAGTGAAASSGGDNAGTGAASGSNGAASSDAGGNTNSKLRVPGAKNLPNGAMTNDHGMGAGSTTSSRDMDTGSTVNGAANATGKNPAFDNDTKVNGVANPSSTPNESGSATMGSRSSGTNSDSDDHAMNNATTSNAPEAKSTTHASKLTNSSKYRTASKSKAKKNADVKTGEPFVDDTGRIPGSNPDATSSTGSTR